MLSTATAAANRLPTAPRAAAPALPASRDAAHQQASQRVAERLNLLKETLPLQRRVVHAGETIYHAGEHFESLHVLSAGFVKIVNVTPDGREQVSGLKFRGDWLGFDGIAGGRHACSAIAMDTGEVWTVRYDALLAACTRHPELLIALHEAMSREISRERESLMSVCTLPADARVADFLRYWAEALARRGLRADQIALRMTRAEIGNYLGMTFETVSRALSRLARQGLIAFIEKGRRDIAIPNVEALADFVQACLAPAPATLQ